MNIVREVALTTGLASPNLLAGSTFELPTVPVVVSLGVNASATGAFITVFSGARVVLEESPPVVSTAFPVVPDNMYYSFVALPNERLVVAARNPTGGTITFRLMADIQPVQ